MSSATFQFDNQPGVTYHAERDLSGFVTVSISAGGERVQVCGFAVTQAPPPPVESEREGEE